MYNKIKVYGGQTINYIHTKKEIDSLSQIQSVFEDKYKKPLWGTNTISLSAFIGQDISASSLNTLDNILGFKVYRKNKSEDLLYFVASDEAKKISDYNVRNNRTYQYYIYPIYMENEVEQIGSPIITDEVTTSWSSWSIVGTKETNVKNVYKVDDDNIWRFNLSIKSNALTLQVDKTYYDGLSKFPSVSYGKKNYKESGISCYFGNVSNEGKYIRDNIELMDKWIEFANNGQLKLIKDRKGDVIPVDIKDFSFQYEDDIHELPVVLEFSYIQIDDAKNLSVYGVTN